MQLLLALLIALPAEAHKPSFGIHPTLNSAFHVDDVDISMVLYQNITCDADQIWLHFDAVQDHEVFFQVGVPELDRLSDYQPELALIAEGLPALEDVPFDVPEGYGGIIFSADATPTPFYEPFTQTNSWIWIEEFFTMPASGNAWLVSYSPDQTTGKMWVAMGTIEDFSDVQPSDWGSWTSNLADFHETDGERDITEQSCAEPVAEASVEATGCATAAPAASWGMLALLAPLVRRRRTSSAGSGTS